MNYEKLNFKQKVTAEMAKKWVAYLWYKEKGMRGA